MKKLTLFLSALLIFASTTVGAFAYDPQEFSGKGSRAQYDKSIPAANQGAKLLHAGKYEEALRYYDKAIAIYPYDAGMHSNRASVLNHLSKTKESVVELNKAVQLEPTWADGYNNLADQLRISKDFSAAQSNCKKAIQLAPGDPLPVLTLAEIYIDMKKYPDAEQLISKAKRMPAAKNDQFIQKMIKVDLEKLSRIR